MAKTSGGIRGQKTTTSTSSGRKREGYIEAMHPLLTKNVIKYVGNARHIKIKFNRKGIEHIADDVLKKNLGISKKELPKLDNSLRDAKFIKSSGLYKDRKDGIIKFYYFSDKNKNLRYNVAERKRKNENGVEHVSRFLYSLTKSNK